MSGPVRQPINVASLEAYLRTFVSEIQSPLKVEQFGFGQSNPTYLLIDSNGQRFVLRKKPPGKLLSPAAHKVEREYRILHALRTTDVPVPKTYCLCEDNQVIGTAFYIMEYLDGRIFTDFTLPQVSAEERTRMWHDAVRILARFHRLDPAFLGLGSFGKAGGFYDRQIATWSEICKQQAGIRDVETNERVGELPHMKDMMTYFQDKKHQPRDRATLIHGDFKIDNLVFHPTEPRVIGILDWEMATIGHPLSDICNLLTKYGVATYRGGSFPDARFQPGATLGLPTLEQCLSWYAEASIVHSSPHSTTRNTITTSIQNGTKGGNSGDTAPYYHPQESGDFAWGMAFNLFRLAAICHGIAARYAQRQASSAEAQAFARERFWLAEFAWKSIQENTTPSSRL